MKLAQKLEPSFQNNDVIVLSGDLGSGKTVFVKGLAKARGIKEDAVLSPSYTFVNEYNGEKPVYHFDLYRMGDQSELIEIGWDDYLSRDGLIVVEWGERAKELLPVQYYKISFSLIDITQREINVSLETR